LVNRKAIQFGSDQKKTSPHEFYQHLLNSTDEDVGRFLRMFTLLSEEEIIDIEKKHTEKLGMRYGQKILAERVTEMIHGKEASTCAILSAKLLFGGSCNELKTTEVLDVFKESNCVCCLPDDKVVGQLIIDVAVQVGIVPTKSEAKRLVMGNGLYLNNNLITSKSYTITTQDLIDNNLIFLRCGKKNVKVIKVECAHTQSQASPSSQSHSL